MSINLSDTFTNVHTIINSLLSDYVSIRFIGFDQQNENSRYYMTAPITSGFYFKHKKRPMTGEVVEVLRIVPQTEEALEALEMASTFEAVTTTGSVIRYSISSTKHPSPPIYEWVLEVVPNRQDKTPIT